MKIQEIIKPPQGSTSDAVRPAVHFVGFRDPQRMANAARIWGEPDFVHMHWDQRAMDDVAPGDTVVFPNMKAQRIVPWSYDDSNQTPGDPAAAERKEMEKERSRGY